MPNGIQQQQEPERIVLKDELEAQRIRLHNLKFNVQIQEVVIKKLEELAR